MKSLIILLLAISCTLNVDQMPMDMIEEDDKDKVEVTDVIATGGESNYNFSVKLSSPDLGCEQYANWWEVVDEDENLVYRRNLSHSHVNEQPFTRSGGPVKIESSKIVIIRGHMNTSGYGTVVYKGSIESGFQQMTIAADFAEQLESQDPLPPKCAF